MTPLTVAMSRSAGARSTSGVSLSVDCVLVPATRAAVAIPGNLKLLKHVAHLAGRPASSVRSCERAPHAENPSLRRNRGRSASVQSRCPLRAEPICIRTAASSDDPSASLSPEAAFAISSTVKSAPTTAGESPGTRRASGPVQSAAASERRRAAIPTGTCSRALARSVGSRAGKEGQLNCIPEQCFSHRTFPFGHRGRYSKPHATAVVPIDAQHPRRSPKQPSRQAPSKLVPSACV